MQQAEAAMISGVPTFNDPGDGVFEAGDTVEVTFTFSQPVRVDTTGGTPSVNVLLSGTSTRQATYLRGSGSGQLVFGYTLAAGDGTHSSLLVEPDSLALNGGAIRDAANNLDAAIEHEGGGVVFARQAPANAPAEGAPAVTGRAQVGETLTATTTGITDADGLDSVSYGYQWLAGDADIAGATASTYTVVAGNVGQAIKVRVTFTDDAGNEESLTSEATSAVTAASLTVESATVDGRDLILTFSETLDDEVTLPTSAVSVSVNDESRSVSAVSVSGSTVTLTLASAVESGDTLTVSYTRPDGPDFIRDVQGRIAESFSDLAVQNSTALAALTASVHNVPTSHDGSTRFEFELRFSPEPSISFRTLREHALDVAGGRAQEDAAYRCRQ